MGTVNVTLGDGKKLNLVLGQQLENAVTAVVFDFSAWKTEFGSGTLGLSVQRHGDDQPYAVVPTVSGNNATWNITELDTAYKGVGEVQVTYTVGSVVKKSTVYKFTVYRSLGENGEYPSPGQTWQEEIEDELADVKQDLHTLILEGATYAHFDQILNKGFNLNDGTFPNENGWDISSFIPVNGGETLHIYNNVVGSAYNGFYDGNKTYLGSFTIPKGTNNIIEVPSNASYMVITNSHARFDYVVWRYPTGVATSSDLSTTNNAVEKLNDGYVPLTNLIKNSYVNRSDGVFKTDGDYVRTDYIKIPSFGLFIGMDSGKGTNGYVALYDSNKSYVGTFYISTTGVERVNAQNAVYVALSGTLEGVQSMKMVSEDGIYHVIDQFGYNKDFNTFFIHGSTVDGEISYNNVNNLVTKNVLYSPFDAYVGIREGSVINVLVDTYDRFGGAYDEEISIAYGNVKAIQANTPFRLIVRKNDGTRITFADIENDLILEYTPHQKEAILHFIGQTPESYPHENVTTSGYFNMIETANGHIIVEDASHASNNAFIADFIQNGKRIFDYFIVSHWHDDHVGLLGEFIRLGRITSDTVVFLPQQLKSNFTSVFTNDSLAYSAYQQRTAQLEELGCTIIYPTENSQYYIDGVVLTFWNTEHDKYYELEVTAKNYNDLSLCFYADIGNIRVGYPGDLGPIGQNQCIDSALKCEVYNAQHHGWDNGVNNLITNYIDRISPNVVVANDGSAHDTYYEQEGSPMVTWCLDNCVPFYRCYPQATGIMTFKISDGTWQLVDSVQRYRRS